MNGKNELRSTKNQTKNHQMPKEVSFQRLTLEPMSRSVTKQLPDSQHMQNSPQSIIFLYKMTWEYYVTFTEIIIPMLEN